MKKALMSLLSIGVIAVVAVFATQAFFNDTETSKGNVLQAGAIDLVIDNHSYIDQGGGLKENPGTTWRAGNLTNELFFNFSDLKPGDLGEDTISLHVDDNPAWLCADIALTLDDDMTCTEPELADDPTCANPDTLFDGDLAHALNFIFWKDDGDNVLEVNEVQNILTQGPASGVLNGAHWALFDSSTGGKPTDPAEVYWIGKAWCFGALSTSPVAQDGQAGQPGNGPDVRGAGVSCNGSLVNNAAQTDKLMGDVIFRAVQARHNDPFYCDGRVQEAKQLILENEDMTTTPNWTPKTGDNKDGLLTWQGDGPTFSFTLTAQGLPVSTAYSLIYYADPFPGNNPGGLIWSGSTDPAGSINVAGNPNLGFDIPTAPDTNIGLHGGGKVWLIPSANYDVPTKSVTPWAPTDDWLFEGNVYINYNDTNN